MSHCFSRCLVHLENPIHLKLTQSGGGGEKKRQPLDTQYVQGSVLAWFLSFCVGSQPIKGKDHSSMLSSYTGPE